MGSLSRCPDMVKESTGFGSGAVEVFQKIADRRDIKLKFIRKKVTNWSDSQPQDWKVFEEAENGSGCVIFF